MHLTLWGGSGHLSVLLVMSAKDTFQSPVKGRLPAVAFDALAAAGVNGTANNSVTGSAWRSVIRVPAGRAVVLSATSMRDTKPVAASLASGLVDEVIRPQCCSCSP